MSSQLSKHEWNAAAVAGCATGCVVALGLWSLALALSAMNRAAPGTGTAGAAAITLAAGWAGLRIGRFMDAAEPQDAVRKIKQ